MSIAALALTTALAAPSEAQANECALPVETLVVVDVIPGEDFYHRASKRWLGGSSWIYDSGDTATIDVEFRFWDPGVLDVDGVRLTIGKYDSVIVEMDVDAFAEYELATHEPPTTGGQLFDPNDEELVPPPGWGPRPNNVPLGPLPQNQTVIKPRPTCPK